MTLTTANTNALIAGPQPPAPPPCSGELVPMVACVPYEGGHGPKSMGYTFHRLIRLWVKNVPPEEVDREIRVGGFKGFTPRPLHGGLHPLALLRIDIASTPFPDYRVHRYSFQQLKDEARRLGFVWGQNSREHPFPKIPAWFKAHPVHDIAWIKARTHNRIQLIESPDYPIPPKALEKAMAECAAIEPGHLCQWGIKL